MVELLGGCLSKLDRAMETSEILAAEVQIFNGIAARQLVITPKLATDGLEYFLIASGHVDIPIRFSVLTGEIVHHMRSALDHLIGGLVLSNGNSLSKNHQFPICSTREQYQRAKDKGMIRGLRKSSYDIIESLQPFAQPVPGDTVLSVIQDYDNQDKHRVLLLTNSLTTIADDITVGSPDDSTVDGAAVNITAFGNLFPVELTADGAIVFSCKFGAPVRSFHVGSAPCFEVALKDAAVCPTPR